MILKWYLISFFCFTRAIGEKLDVYCEKKYDDWEICRTCNQTDTECQNKPSDCHCENIKVKNPRTEKLIGGPDHCDKDGWCYVSKYDS